MHTASEGSTVRIFTILFTGTAGITTHSITIRFSMIRFIILHGILHTTAGAGDTAGIHPITAGAGGIHPIIVTGTGLIMAIMAGVIPTTRGMEADGMQIRIITGTDKEGQPERMCFAAAIVEEGLQRRV